jgi:hypothetical protein
MMGLMVEVVFTGQFGEIPMAFTLLALIGLWLVTLYFHAGGNIKLSNDIMGIEQLATYAQPGGPSAGGADQSGASTASRGPSL